MIYTILSLFLRLLWLKIYYILIFYYYIDIIIIVIVITTTTTILLPIIFIILNIIIENEMAFTMFGLLTSPVAGRSLHVRTNCEADCQ